MAENWPIVRNWHRASFSILEDYGRSFAHGCLSLEGTMNTMKNRHVLVAAMTAAFFSAAFGFAGETGKTVVLSKADLQWKALGNSGVAAAQVSGDMGKGPCRFFLKYPAGLVTPLHHHTANHHVTVISGSITLSAGGKDHLLGPGSYFMLADRAVHMAKVEGKEDAVFYIEAEGPWDVVVAK